MRATQSTAVPSCASCTSRNDHFFCELDTAALKEIDRLSFANSYPTGSVLFAEGQLPRGIFLVCRGAVKLSMSAEDGKTIINRIATTGQVVGLTAAVSGNPHQATAETLEPSDLKFVRLDDFLRFLVMNGPAVSVMRQLSAECEDGIDHLAAIGLSHSAAEKLANLLLRLCNERGEKRADGIRVPMFMTHEQIAQMISTSRETVTRLMHEFRERGVLEASGAALLIRSKEALASLARH